MQKKIGGFKFNESQAGGATFLKNPSRSSACSPIAEYGGQSLVWGPNHVSVRSHLSTCDALVTLIPLTFQHTRLDAVHCYDLHWIYLTRYSMYLSIIKKN